MVSKRRRRSQIPAQGNALGTRRLQAKVMNSERVREINQVRPNSSRQPLQGCDARALITQGSAPAARNPGLELVNAFGVFICRHSIYLLYRRRPSRCVGRAGYSLFQITGLKTHRRLKLWLFLLSEVPRRYSSV